MILSVPNDNHSVCHVKIGDIRLWKHGFVLQYLPFLMQSSANISLFLCKATTGEPCPETGLIKKPALHAAQLSPAHQIKTN